MLRKQCFWHFPCSGWQLKLESPFQPIPLLFELQDISSSVTFGRHMATSALFSSVYVWLGSLLLRHLSVLLWFILLPVHIHLYSFGALSHGPRAEWIPPSAQNIPWLLIHTHTLHTHTLSLSHTHTHTHTHSHTHTRQRDAACTYLQYLYWQEIQKFLNCQNSDGKSICTRANVQRHHNRKTHTDKTRQWIIQGKQNVSYS